MDILVEDSRVCNGNKTISVWSQRNGRQLSASHRYHAMRTNGRWFGRRRKGRTWPHFIEGSVDVHVVGSWATTHVVYYFRKRQA